jgi:hypothetical protein
MEQILSTTSSVPLAIEWFPSHFSKARQMNVSRRCCLVVVAILALTSDAFADGAYFPERAIRKIPEIPAQRAVLAWKDGQETLVISSALDSKSQKLGWIIPLPSVPTTIEKQSPGALKTLNFCIQPEITHDLYLIVAFAVYALFSVNLLLATLLFKREERLGFLLVEGFLLVVLPSLMLPALGPGRPTALKAANVQVEKSVSVGAYDIAVLKSPKPDELNAWLTENGFSALPAAAGKTIADYISNGWVFAATKLTRAESGTNAPHPIKMTFSSKEPVYPLKLTALAGGSTAFEIFVVADDRAACDLLKEEFCQRFTEEKWAHTDDDDPYEAGKYFYCEAIPQQIGHPAICSMMWNKCVVTKLAGTIDADKMTSDILFGLTPFQPYREHFYTVQGAKQSALLVFVCLLGCWLAASMIAYRKRIMEPEGLLPYLGRVLLPAIVLIAIFAAGVSVSLPVLDASEVVTGHGFRFHRFSRMVFSRFKNTVDERPDALQGTEKEIAERLLKYSGDREKHPETTNQYTGTDVIAEDSPGNFTVEKSPKKVIIRVYDHAGRPMPIERPIPNTGKP